MLGAAEGAAPAWAALGGAWGPPVGGVVAPLGGGGVEACALLRDGASRAAEAAAALLRPPLHLYEYGLPHAGLGSLPYMSLLVVEHFATTSRRSDEESGHLVSERSR